jgi:hypothetical protein
MRTQAWTILALLVITVAGVPAQEIAIDARPDLQIDQEHTKWIDHVMRSISTIKPGMTRKDLSRVFGVEGGLSFRTHRKYVYKHCPYIKVDVDFSAAEVSEATNEDASFESPDDRIIKISPPYLEYSIAD